MEKTFDNKEASIQDAEMDLSLQQSLRFGNLDNISKDEDKSTRQRLDLVLMPLLGFCYMLQFLDKMTLSYSSLLGLIKDTASSLPRKPSIPDVGTDCVSRNLSAANMLGAPVSSISDISSGRSQLLILWFEFPLANILQHLSFFGVLY